MYDYSAPQTNRGNRVIVSTADLHFGSIDPKDTYQILKEQFIDKIKQWLELETDWNMEYIENGRNPNYGKIDELISHLNEQYN